MIVGHQKEGWRIVSHYTHGLLSGKIASQLQTELMPDNWVDVLTAIVEHDDQLQDFDEKDYLTESGSPKDFTMGGGTDREIFLRAERIYATAMQKSQLIALLVGRHLQFLYEDLSQKYKPMKKLLDRIMKLGKVQRRLYKLNKGDENSMYDMMLFSDRSSLILCQQKVPVLGRKLEINHSIGGKTYFISRLDENSLTVEPWVFKTEKFELEFEYRLLETMSFKDNSELKTAIEDAKVKIEKVQFCSSAN